MNKFIDYYRVLGITINATDDDIKKAYRDKAKEYHPDRHSDKSDFEKSILEEKFKLVNEAYSTLHNEYEKRKYDIEYRNYYLELARKREEARRREYEESYTRRAANSAVYEEDYYYDDSDYKESFKEKMEEAYQYVKEEEKNMSFRKRHRNISKNYHKKHAPYVDIDSKKDVVLYIAGLGAVHIAGELFTHISRLFKFDTKERYFFRNRKTISAVVLSILLAASLNPGAKAEESITVDNPTNIEQAVDDHFTKTTLYREYEIEFGDTLSEIAYDANISVDELMRINNYTDTRIIDGDIITVPYTVNNEDLSFYTERVEVGEESIYDLAALYETDIETIIELNSESIEDINGNYVILSDTILVPNFISVDELNNIKNNNAKEYINN